MNIDQFLHSPLSSDCRVLKRLYDFDRIAREKKWGYIELALLDIEPYGGTILYRPWTSPKNSLAFATTGGDDVHFGLVAVDGRYGDRSPIVMTVPMAGDTPDEMNFIVGETLHDFLCFGCVHGFFDMEELAYSWRTEFFDRYAKPPSPDDEDAEINEKFRAELSLSPWLEIEPKLAGLEAKYKPLLQFEMPMQSEPEDTTNAG
jgi:hypothetical protein